MMKKLYRSRKQQLLGGVCAGIANYFNIDVTLVRLIWVVVGLIGGSGLLAYIIAWIIIPLEPEEDIIDVTPNNEQSLNSRALGWIIIVIGIILLLRRFEFFLIINRYIIPILLIVLGLFFIFGERGRRD
ncbi:MAG: PspC domain-containing protein [Firmicutes bacterium]|nr:PspC domain-containing protein [Bacillota bacterium]